MCMRIEQLSCHQLDAALPCRISEEASLKAKKTLVFSNKLTKKKMGKVGFVCMDHRSSLANSGEGAKHTRGSSRIVGRGGYRCRQPASVASS